MNLEILKDWPTLETPRLRLRKLTLNDAPDIFAYGSDPQVSRYVIWETHKNLDDSRNFLNHVVQQYALQQPGVWGLELKAQAKIIGCLGYIHWLPVHRKAEIGYVLNRAYWNQGYTTEAVQASLRFGFYTWGLNRIEALCLAENLASVKVLEKAGMKCEGLLRDYYFLKGTFRDLKLYSILRREFLPV